MVRIDNVVTRGGDKGETSLGDGTRVAKFSPRVEALGALDEANAALGLLAVKLAGEPLRAVQRLQNDLFDVGADLCRQGLLGKRLTDESLNRMEAEIAVMNAGLPPLRSFILPGGTEAGAQCHVARSLVRRAERLVAQLAYQEPVTAMLIPTLNRMSDHLFVLGRVLNDSGKRDVLWVPGQ